MRPPRLSLLPVLAILLLLASVGCDRASEATVAGGGTPTVRVGYFANLTHAQAVLGVASGEFATALAPAKLDTRIFNAGPALVEALIAGEIDIGYVGPGPAIAAFTASGGKGVRIISGAVANGVLIVAGPNITASSLADLADKRIATPQHANTQDIAARRYLRTQLKRTDLSNILPIQNAEQLNLLQRGQIDAAWVPEPWGSLLMLEGKARLIAHEKDLWPDHEFATTVVVATPKFLAQHPDLAARFLKVHHGWTERLQQDPQAQLPALKAGLFALTRKRLPEGVLDQAITNVKFTNDALPDSIGTMARWTFEVGFAKQPPKLEGLFADLASEGQGK